METKVAIAEIRDVAKSVAYSTVAMLRMMRAKRSVDITEGIAALAGGVSQVQRTTYIKILEYSDMVVENVKNNPKDFLEECLSI